MADIDNYSDWKLNVVLFCAGFLLGILFVTIAPAMQ